MSSRDVRDILGIPTAAAAAPSSSHHPSLIPLPRPRPRPTNAQPSTAVPLRGINRELQALLGSNAPSLSLSQSIKPKYADKLKKIKRSTSASASTGAGGAGGPAGVRWRWTQFTNPSRGALGVDAEGKILGEAGKEIEGKEEKARAALTLSHWVRDLPADHVPGTPDSKFLKFNTSSAPYSYSSEEFHSFLREDDWSKEETDHLFALAHQFDLRFVVMADRWELPNERSIDDIKSRYYSVCRKLIRHRPAADEATRTSLIQSMSFDKNRELDRKAYLRSLSLRTPAQIAEEDFLFLETRRIEQSYHRFAKEREDVLKILGGREGIGGGGGGVQIGVGGGEKGRSSANMAAAAAGGAAGAPGGSNTGGASGSGGEKRKKNTTGWEIEGVNGAGLPDGWAGEGGQRKSTPGQDLANCIERHPFPSLSAPKALPYPSTSLRSTRVAAPKSAIASRVFSSLTELQLTPTLIMPTRANVEKLDKLLAALGTMVELRKGVDRIEAELRMLRARKDTLLSGTPANATASTSAAVEAVGTPVASIIAAGDDASSVAVVDGAKVEEQEEKAGEMDIDEEAVLETKAIAQTKRSASVVSADLEKNKRARRE